jgi:hypothetical protein
MVALWLFPAEPPSPGREQWPQLAVFASLGSQMGPMRPRRDRFWGQKVLDAFETRSLDPCPGAASNIKTAINCSVSAVCCNCTNRSKSPLPRPQSNDLRPKAWPEHSRPALPAGPQRLRPILTQGRVDGGFLSHSPHRGALRSAHRSRPGRYPPEGSQARRGSFKRFVSLVYWSA